LYVKKEMKCPYCLNPTTKVTDKRDTLEGIRRRRECLKCGKRFTTYERIEKTKIYVIKKDGRREEFDINKIRTGIEKAFEKRPISTEEIDKMIRTIEETIRKKGKKEIPTSFIGKLILNKIKNLDPVAYIRFASVYMDFKDIKDFKIALRSI